MTKHIKILRNIIFLNQELKVGIKELKKEINKQPNEIKMKAELRGKQNSQRNKAP